MTFLPRFAAMFVICLPAVCWAESAEQILSQAGVQGGLIVHLGCGDGRLTGELAPGDAFLVHGLDADQQNVVAARAHLRSLGVYGRVAVDRLRGNRLPYVDDLVNLVVVEELGEVPLGEVMRVLCPRGVAYVQDGGQWTKTVKPPSDETDEWTHFLHGPDNNAVGHDSLVDIPRRMRWLGQPKFARAHEQLASLTGCVTSGGRLFYIIDEAPTVDIRFASQWWLVARDAYNGVILWKRPIPTWMDQFRRFRSGPAGTCFRLAAKDDHVYVTLGADAPVSILDATTGKTLATCKGTENARQILRLDDRLIVLVDTAPQTTKEDDAQIRRGAKPAPGKRAIVAAGAISGKTLWRKEIAAFVHPTLASCGNRLFYQTHEQVYCIDVDSGDESWHAPMKLNLTGHELGWESPTLMATESAVYSADFKKIVAFSATDGAEMWRGTAGAGYNAPPDVFLVDDLLWLKRKGMVGLDPATGEVKKQLPTITGYMHHRCYRNKATVRFFIRGDQGVQFVDVASGDVSPNHWIRGTCQYGIMPANGLLYTTPHSCACNMKTKLSGLWALAPEAKSAGNLAAKSAARWERGPAFGQVDTAPADADSWPVYRHDTARSGVTDVHLPAALQPAWTANIGGKLSGVTIAGGKVFVASVDTHTVHALDVESGEEAWNFTAGGRIDSPPTIHAGMALFGSADGYVYALRASDGQLAWRFRAAPDDQRTFVNGQLESVWPVHGSLLVQGDELIVAAGRSSYLDGGIRLYRLDPATGKMLDQTVMYSPDPETGKQPKPTQAKDVQGVLSDILLADGSDVYMRHVKLDLATGSSAGKGVHLFSPIGLLDDTWWHRGYWVMHDQFIAHWSGWWKAGNAVPSGRILSYDDQSIFGYGRDKYPSGNTGQWRGGEKYQLFACDRPKPGNSPAANPTPTQGRRSRQPAAPAVANRWATQVPMNVQAMLVAGETIFIAGPPDLTSPKGLGEGALVLKDPEEAVAAWQGKRGGMLWAVSAKDGKTLAEYKLDVPPVFDGMAAAAGRLFLAQKDGRLICYGQ